VTVQVNRQNGLGFIRDFLFDGVHGHVVGLIINIYKDWRGTDIGNSPDSRDKSIWNRNNFVTRANIEGPQGKMQRSGSTTDSDTVLSRAVRREVSLK